MPNFNPSSYAQLLAAGVTTAQIRDAINNGLNPSQLPPEYFGLSSGYNPSSVGPGSPTPTPSPGGIEFPPANMADPYATPTPTFNQMNVGGTDIANFGQNAGYFGVPIGFQNSFGGPDVQIPTDPFGGAQFDAFGGTPDYSSSYEYDPYTYGTAGSGALGYSEPTPIPFDPGSMSTGGDMSLGGYGGTNFQQPGATQDVFSPLPTDYSSLGTPGSDTTNPFEGAVAGGSAGTPADPFAGATTGGSPGSGVTPDGMGTPSGYSYAPFAAPTGGLFNMGTYIPAGQSQIGEVGPGGYSVIGVPGTTQFTDQGSFSTALGTSMDPNYNNNSPTLMPSRSAMPEGSDPYAAALQRWIAHGGTEDSFYAAIAAAPPDFRHPGMSLATSMADANYWSSGSTVHGKPKAI